MRSFWSRFAPISPLSNQYYIRGKWSRWIPQFLWATFGPGSPFSDVDPLGIPTGSPPGSFSFGHQNVPVCVHVCFRFFTNHTHCSSVGLVWSAPHSVQMCLHTEQGCFGWPRDGCLHARACHFFSQHLTGWVNSLPPQILSNFT